MIRNFIDILAGIYINNRFYVLCTILLLFFTAGFYMDVFFLLGKILLFVILAATILDFYLLFISTRDPLLLVREMPEKFSNGDDNKIEVYLRNNFVIAYDALVIEELPIQFQMRNFTMVVHLKPHEEKQIEYSLRPTQRGEYVFGRTMVYISSKTALLKRRLIFNKKPTTVAVYPSFVNIRKFEFLAISNRLTEAGIKRIRKIGQQSEFDQIRDYVKGDDLRTVNWKATAKKGRLMTNQYQDERSQQIYNVIDMGRLMKMPFNHMALLDYAINSSLILANTALFKQDKAGLVTFNTEINTFMPAERKTKTIADMLERLYNQTTSYAESNYELLFACVKRLIPHRSLLILYTNFESITSLSRQLSNFQKISRNHLLLVVIFENTEISEYRKNEARTLEDIYIQTIAEKFIYDKKLIIKELANHGIISLLTRPSELSVNLVNKYLELKDRNLL